MRERHTRCFGEVEPSEIVVFCRRRIRWITNPPLDQPDPQGEIGLDNSTQLRPRFLDAYSQLLFQLPGQCLHGRFPALHVPTGEIPHVWKPLTTSRAVAQQNAAVAHQKTGDDLAGLSCRSRCVHLKTLPDRVAREELASPSGSSHGESRGGIGLRPFAHFCAALAAAGPGKACSASACRSSSSMTGPVDPRFGLGRPPTAACYPANTTFRAVFEVGLRAHFL